ncbi:hypothetical protein BVG19_g251 [[Candida] boidinii]|nr:hypothetical protein BVG19_g251 [[Candida] boidinii]OWB49764.1 hypothetical protein B5S27_g1308 [[Candida] boidinii]OWB68168.1 hypothetical protein B5S30_g3542 [[Candida] boidinii]GMF97548.1 unnamed protein product [[Candida] boidinii]
MAPSKSEKVIIVGAGVAGLSTAYSLLQQGFENIHIFDKRDYFTQGYDYFKGCDSPSSDMNKIFRAAYGQQTHYQTMAIESRDTFLKWNEMIKEENFEGGSPIYKNSGNIQLTDQKKLPSFEEYTLKNMSPTEAICISDSDAEKRAIKAGLHPCSVDPFEAKKRGAHLQGVLDTTGGMIIADKCCRWVLHLCQKIGGARFTTHFGSSIGETKELLLEYNKSTGKKKCIGIKTLDNKLHFSTVVVSACGPWTNLLVPEGNEKLEATGGSVCLIKLTDPAALAKYHEDIFPTFTYKMRDGFMGGLYGFPVKHGYFKIGFRGIKWTNAVGSTNSVVKTAYSDLPETNIPLYGLNVIKAFLKENVPEISKITKTRLCWYSDTEDNDFLISYCPYYEDDSLFVVAGDSGHSFMMFGSIGKTITSILDKKGDPFLTNLFSWEREREKLNVINLGESDPRALKHQKMATPLDWYIHGPPKL